MLRLFRKPQPLALSDIDPSRIPRLTADELIRLLGQENRIRTIRRLAGLSPKDYEVYYTPAISRFLNMAQLRPASAADHHAGLGGLATHTLAVTESAMRGRKSAQLPQNADPIQIAAEEHIWTYAMFAAGLLHDAGKMITLTQLVNVANSPDHYRIQFLSLPYQMQTHVNTTLFYLLPEAGRSWLQQYPEILSQLVSYLSGDHYGWGMIGDITQRADGESVAQDRKTGGERKRLPHAPSTPMVERMMRALRKMIYDGDLKFNRNGGAGWVDGRNTYVVCGVAATKVKNALTDEGATDIPTDNTRLFDIWQDHAYIVPNDDKAIWNIKITADDYCHSFSMLKFRTTQIFHPSRRPRDFVGTIEILSHDVDVIEDVAETSIIQQRENVENPDPVVHESAPERSSAKTKQPEEAVAAAKAAKESKKDPGKPASTKAGLPTPKSMESENVGKHFIQWVRSSLQDGRLSINNATAPVHILPEGVALVTPAIFKAYIKHHGFAASDDDEEEQARMYKRLQGRVEKLRKNKKNRRQLNVHSVKIKNSNSLLKVFLFPHKVFYPDGPPQTNDMLTLSK